MSIAKNYHGQLKSRNVTTMTPQTKVILIIFEFLVEYGQFKHVSNTFFIFICVPQFF